MAGMIDMRIGAASVGFLGTFGILCIPALQHSSFLPKLVAFSLIREGLSWAKQSMLI
jgi:hypothetical protein